MRPALQYDIAFIILSCHDDNDDYGDDHDDYDDDDDDEQLTVLSPLYAECICIAGDEITKQVLLSFLFGGLSGFLGLLISDYIISAGNKENNAGLNTDSIVADRKMMKSVMMLPAILMLIMHLTAVFQHKRIYL